MWDSWDGCYELMMYNSDFHGLKSDSEAHLPPSSHTLTQVLALYLCNHSKITVNPFLYTL